MSYHIFINKKKRGKIPKEGKSLSGLCTCRVKLKLSYYIFIILNAPVYFYDYRLSAIHVHSDMTCILSCNMFTYTPIRVFDKLIWRTIGPLELFIWHSTVLSLGRIVQLIMIILSP